MIKIKKNWVEKKQTVIFSRHKGEFCQNDPRNFQFREFERATSRPWGPEFIPKRQERVKFFLKINRIFDFNLRVFILGKLVCSKFKKNWVEKTQTDMFSRHKGEFCQNIPRNFQFLEFERASSQPRGPVFIPK